MNAGIERNKETIDNKQSGQKMIPNHLNVRKKGGRKE